ncbi:TPA: hypothetical protein QDA74_005007 [Burkholderia territorii]|uniref:hypothetical protein n=1 Tax=Burkholderia territorii TaxID=1503055 RepID=UPI0011C9967C|nr:hypothetical protein [Burkholderia territorii]TXG05584.1 hypothetical protein FU139_26405 [Burkholderia territorii]HDR8858109.1 hypothetical protein [Burkholderia territorii]HDR8862238.1 hypothetical protein [Burkholderia territorii]HDR8870083.1 hypothetical protein [Burkholderia territorii]HDR8879477.1 hypothetical protein [Burkholderia territorii]
MLNRGLKINKGHMGFGKHGESTGKSTIGMAVSQRSRDNDHFTTQLELRRAFAVFKCCASYGTYVDLNDIDTGWNYLREEGLVSTSLEAAWKEATSILATCSNAGMLAEADKERASQLMDAIEAGLNSAEGQVEGIVDAVVAMNVARLKYPSKSWLIDGILAALLGVPVGAVVGSLAGELADNTPAIGNVVFGLVVMGSVLVARYRHQRKIVAADAKIAEAQAGLDRVIIRNLSPRAFPS